VEASKVSARAPRERGKSPARARGEIEMVRVLDEDPELGFYLPGPQLKLASAAAIAPLLRIEPGTTSFVIDEPMTHAHLGFLVLEGLIVRHVFFGELGASELYGSGDLLHPWLRRAHSTAPVRWEVLAPTRLAALDEGFADRIHAWPELAAGLIERAAERADFQALQAALRQAKRVEDRVQLALWHFAARWGETGPEGRTVRLPNVTGELLARFVGARRQTVSTALGRLADRGELRRNPDGGLTLAHAPAQLERIEAGRRVHRP